MRILNQNYDQDKKQPGHHSLTLEDRRKLDLSGVDDVLGFDESSVLLRTSAGMLTVEGEQLHIRHMSVDCGELSIEGKINGLIYVDKTTRKNGLFGKRSG